MQHNRKDKFGQSTQDKLRELFYSRYVKQHHTSQFVWCSKNVTFDHSRIQSRQNGCPHTSGKRIAWPLTENDLKQLKIDWPLT
jgi:hypothetical protein